MGKKKRKKKKSSITWGVMKKKERKIYIYIDVHTMLKFLYCWSHINVRAFFSTNTLIHH